MKRGKGYYVCICVYICVDVYVLYMCICVCICVSVYVGVDVGGLSDKINCIEPRVRGN